jgi:6-phosphogluconolactonase
MTIEVFATARDLAEAAATLFVTKSSEAVAARSFFTVALSGGSTPKLLYQLLSDQFREQVPWPSIHFFWTDERHVSPDDPESNYRMANEAMLSRVPVSKHSVHRIKSENPNGAEAAAEYEQEILKFVPGSPPRFDLILLGLGTDGHTASIFPDSEVLHETKQLVAAPWVEKLNAYRITMTLPLLNSGASVVFLVTGTEKADVVRSIVQTTKSYPAKEVRPTNGELLWLLDRDAANKLKPPEEVSQETIKALLPKHSSN